MLNRVFEKLFMDAPELGRFVSLASIGGILGMRWFAKDPGTTILVVILVVMSGLFSFAEGVQCGLKRS